MNPHLCVPRLPGLAILLPMLLGQIACARHVFEPVPSTPEAVLAFKLRTLRPGSLVQIRSAGDDWTEGRVLAASPGAGAVFGTVIYAASPEWIQVYPLPAGVRR